MEEREQQLGRVELCKKKRYWLEWDEKKQQTEAKKNEANAVIEQISDAERALEPIKKRREEAEGEQRQTAWLVE